jgi:NTP pyrophosphatase (non-canonical NTP hydrolase)
MRTILALQEDVDNWIMTYGVRYFSEMTNLAILIEEVGELSSLMSRKYGEQSFKEGNAPVDIKMAIADEMADVVFVLTCLANQMDIDLNDAVDKNLAKKTDRDKDRHTQNTKLR